MRPRLIASENQHQEGQDSIKACGFNEAEADRLGKRCRSARCHYCCSRFNEAEADRLGKHVDGFERKCGLSMLQ